MDRRGFLKLLTGAIAAAAVPAARALPSPPIPAAVTAPALAIDIAPGPISLIRSISFSGVADFDKLDFEYLGVQVELPRSVRVEIDVEMFVDFGDCPRPGALVDAKWFKDRGVARMFMDERFLDDWPDDLRFMVTETQMMSEFPRGPIIAHLKMVEAR